MDWTTIAKTIEATMTGVGLQVIGAIVLYIVGRWLIGFAVGHGAKRPLPAEDRTHPAALHR